MHPEVKPLSISETDKHRIMEVLIFKTNASKQSEVSSLQNLLSRFAHIIEVSVDLEDCDKVLRIVGNNPSPTQIQLLVSSLGLTCSEMKD